MTGPGTVLDWDAMWCARHLEPFRAEWPKGAAVAMVELLRRALAMPAVIDAAKADTEQIDVALRRFAPICCFVSHEDLQAVYALAGVTP